MQSHLVTFMRLQQMPWKVVLSTQSHFLRQDTHEGTNCYAVPRQANMHPLPLALWSIFRNSYIVSLMQKFQFLVCNERLDWIFLSFTIFPKSSPSHYILQKLCLISCTVNVSLPQLSTIVTATSFTVNLAST